MAPIKRRIASLSNTVSESDEASLDMYDASDAASDLSQQAAVRQKSTSDDITNPRQRKRAKPLVAPGFRLTTPANDGSLVDDDDDDEDDENGESMSDAEDYEAQATQAIQRRRQRDLENLPAENGIIQSVQVINFMCHKNFEFTFGPLINFICGKNGSGKSAVLTALTLCLGGKASSTNRGQSLKNFIKVGEESAIIIVKLKNEGDTAYMPEDYGKTIVVERHFNKSGTSGFKIKNEKGRVITTRKADLEEICDYFALQIDNPMNVLSQDLARQFIGSSSPAEKYKFFIRGVQLEQLDQDYRILQDAIFNMDKRLELRQEDIKELEGRRDKAKLRLQLSDKHESLRDRIRKYSRQMAWAQVEEQERVVEAFNEQLRTADQKIADAESQTAEFEQAFDAAHAAAVQAGEAQEEVEQEIARAEDEKKEAKAVHDAAKNELSDFQAQQRSIRDSLKAADATITEKQRAIADERERLEDLNGGSHGRKLAELDQLKEEAEAAQDAHKDHENERAQLDDDLEQAEEDLKSKREPIERKEEEINRSEGLLQSLMRDRGSQVNAFHERLPELLREISRERSFADKPVGPVGNHVRLLKPEWSSQLEKAFGATLSSFIVTSKKDMDILSRIMKRTRCECQILIGSNQAIDTRAHEPDESFDTVLRALDIDNDLVKRQLVIQHGIEQTLLIADLDQATEMMYTEPRPRNVKRCYCINRHAKRKGYHLTYTRNGDASQDPIAEYQGRPRMKTDHEIQINLQRDAIQGLKRELNQLEEDRRNVRAQVERCKQAIVRHRRQERDLQIEAQRAEDAVDALKEEIEKDSVEDGRLDVLQNALEEAKEDKTVNEGSYQDSVNAIDQAKQKLVAERHKLTEMDVRIEQFRAKSKKVEAEATKLVRQRATALGKKNAAFTRIDDAKQDRTTLQRKRQEIVERVASYIEKASQISPRVNIDPGETPNSLDKKLEKLETDLERMQREVGATREELAIVAAQTQEAYQTAQDSVQELKRLAQKLTHSLHQRQERWVRFRGSISARAKIQFKHLLSERSFRGEVLTNHKKKLLDIQVEPDITNANSAGRGGKTLSGGEKSFSQICLLLSIWEAMGSPIRCLDEFDVFMDSVNRKMSIDLLMTAARRSAGRQFILISPGSKDDFAMAPDIHVQE